MVTASKIRLCATHEAAINPICSECLERTDIYIGESTVCPTCHFGKGFVMDTILVGTCEVCAKTSHLNGEGICINCYVERESYNAEDDSWGTMKGCETCGRMTQKSRKNCSSCTDLKSNIAVCRGCLKNFKLERGEREVFCRTCIENIQNGSCTNCHEENGEMNDRGWCISCEETNYG